jgi:glycosyltransferase involved in cell wall biosynthesis
MGELPRADDLRYSSSAVSSRELVSVVVPTFNRAAFVCDAIASISAQGDGIEIVVVDDGSTDDTERVVAAKGTKVTYVRLEHRGVSAARNRGILAARGQLLAFLDSDDLWPNDSLARRRAHLDRHPDVDLVYGLARIRHIGNLRRKLGPYDENVPIRFPLLGSMLCKRTVFDRVGLFDEALEHAEDVDWFARVKESRIPTSTIDEVTLEYRLHDGNMTFDVDRNQAFLLRALKKSLDRRRS